MSVDRATGGRAERGSDAAAIGRLGVDQRLQPGRHESAHELSTFTVTVAFTADDHNDGAMLFADMRHDPTCPNWAAFCKDSNPNHRDVLWGPIIHEDRSHRQHWALCRGWLDSLEPRQRPRGVIAGTE